MTKKHEGLTDEEARQAYKDGVRQWQLSKILAPLREPQPSEDQTRPEIDEARAHPVRITEPIIVDGYIQAVQYDHTPAAKRHDELEHDELEKEHEPGRIIWGLELVAPGLAQPDDATPIAVQSVRYGSINTYDPNKRFSVKKEPVYKIEDDISINVDPRDGSLEIVHHSEDEVRAHELDLRPGRKKRRRMSKFPIAPPSAILGTEHPVVRPSTYTDDPRFQTPINGGEGEQIS